MQEENLIKIPTEFARVLGRMGLTEYEIVEQDPDGIVISAPIEFCRILIRMGLVGYSKDSGSKQYDLTYTNTDGKITAEFTGEGDRVITPGEDVINRNESVNMYLTADSGYVIDTVKVNSQTESINAETFNAVLTEKANKDITVTTASKVSCSLTYSLGAYGTGDVPTKETVAVGSTVTVKFVPAPKRYMYKFIGWATTDGASVAEYAVGGTTSITLDTDVTLYPVFEDTDQYIAIDNTDCPYDVKIVEEGDGTLTTVLEVAHGTIKLFDFEANAKYYIEIENSLDATGSIQGLYKGTYNGVSYDYEQLDSSVNNSIRYIPNPYSRANYWDSLVAADRGTLVVRYHQDNNYLRIQPKGHQVAIYELENGSYVEQEVVRDGGAYDYAYSSGEKFMLGVKDSNTTNMFAKFTGEYGQNIYLNSTVNYGTNSSAFEYNRFLTPVASVTPAGDVTDYEWTLVSGASKLIVGDIENVE